MSAAENLTSLAMAATADQTDVMTTILSLLPVEPANEKEEYISAIIKRLIQIDDISLLDLIYKLLQKGG